MSTKSAAGSRPEPLGVLASLVSPEGGRDQLAAALEDLRLAAESEPGTILFAVHEDRDTPGRFEVFERYADAAAADTHRGTEAMVRFRTALSSLGIRPTLTFLTPLEQQATAATGPRRLLVVTGGHRVALDEFLVAVGTICADRGWVWAHVTHPVAQQWLRPEHAGRWDAILLHDIPGLKLKRGTAPEPVLPDDDTARALVDLLDRGQGLVVLHHAISSWPAWEGWAEAIGGRFLYAPGTLRGVDLPSSGYRMATHTVQIADDHHPVTAGVDNFQINDELYFAPVLADRVHPLLTSDADFSGELFQDTFDEVSHGVSTGVTCAGRGDASNLIGWTTVAGRSPIVYLQPGDGPSTFADPQFQLLLGNAMDYVASQDAHTAAAAEPFQIPLP
jgi:quinol monooxygenase YgiN/type 1 glutamine amidotransferase